MKKILCTLLMSQLFFKMGLFAQAEEAPQPAQTLWQTVIMIGIAVAFFYVILWRPEQKRRKAMEEQRSAMKKGDRVTAMGIIGTVVSIKEQTVILKMFDGSKIEFLKAAITDVLPGTEEQAKKAEKSSKEELEETEEKN